MVRRRLEKGLEGYFFPKLRDLVVNVEGDIGYGEWKNFSEEGKMKDLENPTYVSNYGFMFQWCCKCKACHVWHFEIIRGRTEEDDYVVISHAGYPELSKLLKFYEKGKRKK